MAYNKDEKFTYEIKEILGIASPQEDLRGDWVKAVLLTLMGNGETEDKEEGVDIRKYHAGKKIMRNGLRLSIQEANNVCDILLQNGYGSLDVIKSECEKRQNMFSGKE